jgi:heme/copper-type cytochrome/quinol oxidase subunit 2
MNLLSFLSFLILAITLLTMVFGVIAYFLYKARERKKRVINLEYEVILERENAQMLFFTKE